MQINTVHSENKGLKQYKFIDIATKKLFREADLNMYVGKGQHYKIVNPLDSTSLLPNPKHGLPRKEKFLSTGLFEENSEGNLYFTDLNQIVQITDSKYAYANIIFGNDCVIGYKNFLDKRSNPNILLTNYMGSDDKLMQNLGLKFDYTKRVGFIKYLVKMCTKQDIVLDFFAGSGTTGHAVAELNAEDGGNRQYILCTNNENNIAEEITFERLKRISNPEEYDLKIKPLPHNLTYKKISAISEENLYEDQLVELLKLQEGCEIDNKYKSIESYKSGDKIIVFVFCNTNRNELEEFLKKNQSAIILYEEDKQLDDHMQKLKEQYPETVIKFIPQKIIAELKKGVQ